jgi:hypothetical protein
VPIAILPDRPGVVVVVGGGVKNLVSGRRW